MKSMSTSFARWFLALLVALLIIGCEGSPSPGFTATETPLVKVAPSDEYVLIGVSLKKELSGEEVNPLIGELAMRHTFTPQFLSADAHVQGFTALLPRGVLAELAVDRRVLSAKELEQDPASGPRCASPCKWSKCCGVCICPGQICYCGW